jgi:uncharacterized protein (TIGR03437 family)
MTYLRLSLVLVLGLAPVLSGQSTPYTFLQSGYTQEVFAASNTSSYMGGIAFAPDGDVWTKLCGTTTGPLRFDLNRTVTVNGTSVHPLQTTASVTTAAGCGMTNYSDGRIYLNSSAGAQRLDADTGAVLGVVGPPGNLYGITVDPQTNRLVYAPASCAGVASCTLVSVDPATGSSQNLTTFPAGGSLEFVDGITFDPTGKFIIVCGRTGVFPNDPPFIFVLNRNGTLARQLQADHFPDSATFHLNPLYLVTNNNDGTISRYDFPADDLTQGPTQTLIATGGFRGDLTGVGPDGCYYITEAGTRYANFVSTADNSIVRICSTTGKFMAGPGVAPQITLVANAFGDTPLIAPNTWVEIKGTNLAPPGDTRIWKDPDFLNNQLPTQLDGVGVTVNGVNAFVYFVSPTQINILTPPDPLNGPMQVQTNITGVTSNAATVQGQSQSLSLFEFVAASGKHYVYGRHIADNTIIGPTSLFPGLTTPVKPGETIYIAGNGFGPTDTPVTRGALTQSGTLLKPWPVVQIGGVQANVLFAGLVSPGTFIFNIVVPSSLPDGDLPLTVTFNSFSIQSNVLITIQH